MGLLRYVTHPNVAIDPNVAVPEWGLSRVGRSRTIELASQSWWSTVEQLVSSPETKALETAQLVSASTDLEVEVRPDTHEIDRSSTGFVSPERHEELADQCFSEPHLSADGWERAIDAQVRVASALRDLLAAGRGDCVVIGHGGVGTLLWCYLVELVIDRRHDQPGQGHYWTFDLDSRSSLHAWLPIDLDRSHSA